MADPEAPQKAETVATPDAMAQVEALRSRVMHSDAAVEEANRRAAAAAADAAAATAAAERATAAAEAATASTRVNELERANSEMADLRARYKAAHAEADADAMADIQVKMARAGARIDRLETAKENSDTRRPAADTGRVVAREASPGDPREQFLATRTTQTAAWLRQHPEFFSDNRFNAKVRAADLEWEAEGKPKDTAEYFAHIERKAGLIQDPPVRAAADGGRAVDPAAAENTGAEGTASDLTPAGTAPARRQPPQAGRQRAAPVAAPPTRDGAPPLSGRGDGGVKRITPEMQQWARMMYPPTKDNPDGGIDPEAYYDEYRRLVDEGEINDRFGR